MINLNLKQFKLISSSNVKDIGTETKFNFCQKDGIIYGVYNGGAVKKGSFIAKIIGDGTLEKRFQHVNENGNLVSGKSYATTEVMADGRLRLKETWTDESDKTGSSIYEEILKSSNRGTSFWKLLLSHPLQNLSFTK